MSNYRRRARIACSLDEVFAALTRRVDHWWSRDFEGSADVVGAEFTVRFGETFKTLRVIELDPGSRVTWCCVASHLDLAGLESRSEWDGTRVEWTFEESGGAVILEVTHVGLTPSLGCYGACESGWDDFMQRSLVPFLESGDGRPFGDAGSSSQREDAA